MEKQIELLKEMRDICNSDYYHKSIGRCATLKEKEKFVMKSLEFIIATRRCDALQDYMQVLDNNSSYNKYNDIRYYMVNNLGIDRRYVNKILIENVIDNGFVFHGTNAANKEGILNDGLLPLRERIRDSFYVDAWLIDDVYKRVYNRNFGRFNMPKDATFVINKKMKSSNIYLTPFIDNAFSYSACSNEWIRTYFKSIIEAFGGNVREIPWDNAAEMDEYMLKTIDSSRVNITEEEKSVFSKFLRKYYVRNGKVNDENTRTIVMVPNDSEGLDINFKKVSQNMNAKKVEDVLNAFRHSEVVGTMAIPKEQLGIIEISQMRKSFLR